MFYKNSETHRPYFEQNSNRQFGYGEAQKVQAKLFDDAYSSHQNLNRDRRSLLSEKQLLERELKAAALYRRQLMEAERRLLAEIYFMALIYRRALYRHYQPHHLYNSFRHWTRPRVWLHEAEKTEQFYRREWHDFGHAGAGLAGRLIADAHHNLGKPVWAFTRFASVCQSGNLGCAATVSELLQEAGVKIGGSAGVYGVVEQLNKLGWKKIKINEKEQFRPGDVVFGVRGPHGHIGLISAVAKNKILVCDNSSSSGTLKERTIESGGSFSPNGRFAGSLYVMRHTSG